MVPVKNPPQSVRLGMLLGYAAMLGGLSWIALGDPVPPGPHEPSGLWLYSGLFALVLGVLLDTPWFSAPRDALSAATVAFLAVLGFGLATGVEADAKAEAVWYAALAAECVVIIAAIVAILLKDAKGERMRRAGETSYLLASQIGRPSFVASVPFVFAIFAFHRSSAQEVLWLLLGWTVIVLGRPLERLWTGLSRLAAVWQGVRGAQDLGEVVGHGSPGLLTIRHDGEATVDPGDPLLVPGEDGQPNVALALNYIGVSDGLWLKALQLDLSADHRESLRAPRLGNQRCYTFPGGPLLARLDSDADSIVAKRSRLLGIVAPGTDLQDLQFEIVRDDLDLEEGRLVEVAVGERPVLFQLLNGVAREDILHQKNTHGFISGRARKLGTWSPAIERFERVQWLPDPNAPVFLVENRSAELRRESIGHVPHTDYGVRIGASDLVTHNAAILGILGIGKTYLALELVERVLQAGIKVICLDLTDQYLDELAPYVDPERQRKIREYLGSIPDGREDYSRNIEEGGAVQALKVAVEKILRKFVEAEDWSLLVLNPSEFTIWRQTGGMFKEEAAMATITPAWITRIITESALTVVQDLGMTDEARCCLVYEEAHSLVPEFTAVANEGDKEASNGTARAILQGRKYGLGCLVVTQRTASVTKSVLNQCNTVFALRVFDATGMEFLSNYIGPEYSRVLSSLRDRHAVVFGKASSCADPLLIRVNDRDRFLAAVREPAGDANSEDQSDDENESRTEDPAR